MNFWILIPILILAYTIGDILSKEYSFNRSVAYLIGVLMCYTSTTLVWLYAVSKGLEIGRGSMLFAIVSTITGLVVGYTLYNESLTTIQTIGLVFGLLSIILLNM